MSADWSKLLQTVAPWIGAAAAGNVPALVGMAAKTIGDAIGKPVTADVSSIGAAIAGATPEQMLAIKQADNDFALNMQKLGFEHAEHLEQIGLQQDALAVDDVKDARLHNANNAAVFHLAYVVLGTFAAIMSAVLYGCYQLISGGIVIADAAVVAAIAGLVGSVVGYVAANAQTTMNFIFGGSLGSRASGTALADATKSAISQLGR